MFIKLDFFLGKYISLVFGFQNFVIDLIWYCIRFFFGYAAKKKFKHVLVDIVVGRNVAGQNFKIPVTFMRSRKISGRGYKLCPTLDLGITMVGHCVWVIMCKKRGLLL